MPGVEYCVDAGLYLLPLQRHRMKNQLRQRVHEIRQELDRSEYRRDRRCCWSKIFMGVFKLHISSFVFAIAISAQLSDELDRVELLVCERRKAWRVRTH